MKDHKRLYGIYIRSSMLVSLIIVILVFLFVPTIEVVPYRGVVDPGDRILPPDVFPPVDKPEPLPPDRNTPQPPVEPADPDDDDAIATIDSTIFRENPFNYVPTGPKIDIVEFYKLEVKPKLLNNPIPKYPEIVRKAGIEGKLFVKMLLDTSGAVMDVKVLKSSGNQMLDQAAIAAAFKCRFTPAMQRERKVRVWVARKFEFRLTDSR
jgi:protein TonB